MAKVQTIPVQDYTIHVGNIFPALNAFLKTKKDQAVVVLVDKKTNKHCLPILKKQLNHKEIIVIRIPAGELHKNIETCQSIWQQMMDKGLTRNALCINLGGGVELISIM